MADSPLPPGAERHLLFGLLAWQIDFVSCEQLTEATNDWLRAPQHSLGETFVRRGVLDDDDRTDLEKLVEKHIGRHGGDVDASLATVRVSDEMRAWLLGLRGNISPSDIPDTLLPDASSPTTAPQRDSTPTAVNPNGHAPLRYSRLKLHARGGLGEVFLAKDEELGRSVALKEIQTRYADHPDSRARFVREAVITGVLEHPGIVPVYGLGIYPDGRPFYAMRFIKGRSLHDAITAFHAGDVAGRDPRERSLALRGLLGQFVDVCNAIGFAHSHGVIHRDIKPTNIMLGDYGETLVVDWGLAKVISQPAEDQPQPTFYSSDSAEATMMGLAVGTPAFMSPEQAAGRHDDAGPAADIYSLGATLYVLLTGVPAFSAYGADEAIRQVLAHEFPPPRQVKRAVPAALDAVVLKAMSATPEDRYPSTAALAGEVERWLADEPVEAYPEPAWQRAQRWAHRHRTLVSGIGVLLLTAIVALAMGLYFVRRERDIAEENLARAEKNLKLAKTAVDQCFLVATEAPLLQKDGMRGVRQILFSEALPFYKNFLKQRPDDMFIQEELGRTHFRVGVITEEIGRKGDAIESYREARRVFMRLAELHSDDEKYWVDLARICNNLGNLQSEAGQRQDAVASYEQAQRLREKLTTGIDRPELRADLAMTLTNLAALRLGDGRPDEARRTLLKAIEIQRQLVALHANATRYETDLAATLNHLGVTLAQTGDREGAARAYQESRERREKLARLEPDSARRRAALADTLINQGVLFSEMRRADDARRGYEQARDIFAALAGQYPEVTEFRAGLAHALMNLGDLHLVAGKPREALDAYRRADGLQKQLVKDQPEVVRHSLDLAATALGLGDTRSFVGEAEPALSDYERVLKLLAGQTDATARLLLRRAHIGRARALGELKRHAAAAVAWAAADDGAEGDTRAYLRAARAAALAQAGDHGAAMKVVAELRADKTLSGERLYSLACVAALSSSAARREGRPAEAARRAALALELLERARVAKLFDDAEMVAHMRKDSDLDGLRSLEGFRAFLRRVGPKPKGK